MTTTKGEKLSNGHTKERESDTEARAMEDRTIHVIETASDVFFNTRELLEEALRPLCNYQLLNVRRVSKTFKTIIDTWTPLRQNLFLQPVASHAGPHYNYNYLLLTLCESWWPQPSARFGGIPITVSGPNWYHEDQYGDEDAPLGDPTVTIDLTTLGSDVDSMDLSSLDTLRASSYICNPPLPATLVVKYHRETETRQYGEDGELWYTTKALEPVEARVSLKADTTVRQMFLAAKEIVHGHPQEWALKRVIRWEWTEGKIHLFRLGHQIRRVPAKQRMVEGQIEFDGNKQWCPRSMTDLVPANEEALDHMASVPEYAWLNFRGFEY